MEMQDVEVVEQLDDMIKLDHVMHAGITLLATQPQGLRYARAELGPGEGVAAGKEDYLMAAPHQFLGEIVNDPFGSSVSDRRNAFMER